MSTIKKSSGITPPVIGHALNKSTCSDRRTARDLVARSADKCNAKKLAQRTAETDKERKRETVEEGQG